MLEVSRKRWKTSVGIWAFGPAVTRFVPGGYKPELRSRDVPERLKWAVEGLGPLVDGYEFHYETEIDEDNAAKIQEILGRDHQVAMVCYGLVPNPRFQYGALANPDPARRREAVEHLKRGIDLAASLGPGSSTGRATRGTTTRSSATTPGRGATSSRGSRRRWSTPTGGA